MFLIYERDRRMNDRKRCRTVAAFLVLILVLFNGTLLLPQSLAAEEDSDRAPHVVDWGLFDEETGTQTSLMESGVIEGDPSGMVFYIKFDHNVAQMDGTTNIGEQNCGLVSVASNGGKRVDATAWVKDTQLEFQYRQCIFVAITGPIDPKKYYHIAVAPGITAKNGFTNNGGTDLYFSFPTSGGGDTPVPLDEPAGEGENAAEQNTEKAASDTKKAENEKAAAKDSKKTNASANQAGSGSSQGARNYNRNTQTANRENAGNGTKMPLPQKPQAVLRIYQIDAGVFGNPAEEAAAEEQKNDDSADATGMDARSMIAMSVMIALCLLMIAAGAACESLSFRYRLRHR